MFHNLKAEMARIGLTIRAMAKRMAEEMKISETALYNKMNGKTDFTLTETNFIQREWFSHLTLEYLFEKNRDKDEPKQDI